MAKRVTGTSVQTQELDKWQERAHRILDAAGELILRWGYNKTTIEDIAKQAGVGKGTIYLHWKTREDLFRALILREQLSMGDELKQGISSDPVGVTLRGIYKYTALAMLRRPLMKAILLGDTAVLGKMAHTEHGTIAFAEKLAGFIAYLQFLRDHNLVRSDLNLEAQLYTVSAVTLGFFYVEPLMPDGVTQSSEQIADLIGETIHCTLETNRPIPAEEYAALSQTFIDYIDRMLAVGYERLQQELRGVSS